MIVLLPPLHFTCCLALFLLFFLLPLLPLPFPSSRISLGELGVFLSPHFPLSLPAFRVLCASASYTQQKVRSANRRTFILARELRVVVAMSENTAKGGAAHYALTRFSSLKPPMNKAPNPIKLLRLLNRRQWLFFAVAFIAWTWDAFDFFTVSLTVSDLAEQFDKSNADITWGITLVLMLRSVGAIAFGIASDRWGRKWPFVVNNILFIILELGTGFVNTYKQFLAVRALFGIAMGGLYGNAAATALEDCPEAARGLISGMLQQGYAFGYLLAVVFSRALVNTTSHGWRPVCIHIERVSCMQN